MSISVSDFHDDIRGVLKKHNSYFVSPEDIDFAINKACKDVLDTIIKEYEASPRRFMADQELLIKHSFSGDGTTRALPSDVYKVAAIFDGTYEGDLLSADKFNDRLHSVILTPSSTRCIATIYNTSSTNTIEFSPTSTAHSIKYWKVPATAKYNYTQSAGVITYTASGSTQIDFPASEYTRLFNRTLTYLAPSSENVSAAQLEQNIFR